MSFNSYINKNHKGLFEDFRGDISIEYYKILGNICCSSIFWKTQVKIMKYVTKPVLVRRKRNVTGSLSFGRQIGFQFTVFNTNIY